MEDDETHWWALGLEEGTEELTWSSRTVEHGKQGGAMLSFGGGHHMCTGRRFGFLQATLTSPYPP